MKSQAKTARDGTC